MTLTDQPRSHCSFGEEAELSGVPLKSPIPALEQNSAIGPARSSVSATTRAMSFSLATSHANARPATDAATRRAPSALRSAATTVLAPSLWNRSHSALPIPSAPPVTTTTLPRTSILQLPSNILGILYDGPA